MSQHSSDQEALLLGEETASLFHRYGRALFAYVRLHVLSREDCKDITLEVFQIALRYDDLTQISEEERFTWLRRVASHKIVDRRRRTMRYPETTLEAVAEILFNGESSDPESIVLQEEAHLRLRHLIRRLPTGCATRFSLNSKRGKWRKIEEMRLLRRKWATFHPHGPDTRTRASSDTQVDCRSQK